MIYHYKIIFLLIITLFIPGKPVQSEGLSLKDNIYNPGILKPVDSQPTLKTGDLAPLFSLPAISGKTISLDQYRGIKNVLLTFVPAAWTPVCSDQWPGYNIAKSLFDKHDTTLIGISTDNIPTLFAWTKQMGVLWFDVVSDFWPHGAVSDSYGILRSDGTAERALVLINKQGRIAFFHVSDINVRPDLKLIIDQLKAFPDN